MDALPAEIDTDIVVIGGGPVGASLAAALADTAIRIVIVEPYPVNHDAQPTYNERTVALTWSARQIYTGMGIWSQIADKGAQPIVDIHVSTRGQYGMTHLHSRDVGTAALGYVVPTRILGDVLFQRLGHAGNVTLLQGASAVSIRHEDESATVSIEQDGSHCQISAKLTVLADGGHSAIGDAFPTVREAYAEQALLTFVTPDQPHNGRAYERFTDEGPLALLPHSENRYAVVWTSSEDNLAARLDMDDDTFIAALQERFGDRAGNFSRPAPRMHYPLSRLTLANPVGDRCVVIGNAAHTVHPVAGQGFNLGLRDAAALAEMILDSHVKQEDIGAASLLAHYARKRKHDTSMVQQFTHGLISLFASGFAPAQLARSAALQAIELVPAAKRFLLNRTMGMHAGDSRLAMGLPIHPAGIQPSNTLSANSPSPDTSSPKAQ